MKFYKNKLNIVAIADEKFLKTFEYEWSCVSCRFNFIKRKHELTKVQRKKLNFIKRLKYAEHKICYFSIEVNKTYEGDD